MDTNASEGTLSVAEFDIAARVFVENWKRTNSIYPPWSLVEGYLTLERICLCRPTEEDGDEVSERVEEDPCCCGSEGNIDAATLNEHRTVLRGFYLYSVYYKKNVKDYYLPHFSLEYGRQSVNLCRSQQIKDNDQVYCELINKRIYGCSLSPGLLSVNDGRPLTFDELEKDLPFYSSKILMESKWTFITQEEHPYLKRPWYKLHPCGTSEWMKLMLLGENHMVNRDSVIRLYLASWLSFVGQVVGLVIPFKMLNENNNDDK